MKTLKTTKSWLPCLLTLLLLTFPLLTFGQLAGNDWGFSREIQPYVRRVYNITRVVVGLLVAADIIWIGIKISQRDNNLKIQIIALLVLIGIFFIVPAIINGLTGMSL